MDNSKKAVVKTLLYHDIFDYPLTEEEVWKFLISEKSIKRKVFDKEIDTINTIVYKKKGYLHMEEKSFTVEKRLIHKEESRKKLKLASRIAHNLSKIPTVLLIGISGNLAMMNAEKNDDIDFFVISSRGTAWITRFMLILYLKLLGKHRKKGDKIVKNKFCLNMIIDESALKIPKNLRNLYTAHEIVQLSPIIQKRKIYQKFLSQNSWIEGYLPNAIRESGSQGARDLRVSQLSSLASYLLSFPIVESMARFIQKVLIRRNLTRETIKNNFIALHPKDYNSIILDHYSKKLYKYGLKV